MEPDPGREAHHPGTVKRSIQYEGAKLMKMNTCPDVVRSFMVVVAAILLAVPLPGFAFNLAEMNTFYQSGQCPGCDLSHGKLLRVKASKANLVEAKCNGLNLSDAILTNSDLSDADFTGAKLFAADLRNAKLQRTNLKGANLIVADLSGADLSNANLVDANLKGANLVGAKIEGADFSGATWPDWGKCKQGSIGECKK